MTTHAIEPTPQRFIGHDPTAGPDGTDVLLTVYPDGSRWFATRPGRGYTELRWGPETLMEVAE